MSQTKAQENAGTVRLCTANDLVYKAYSRPYDGSGSAPVINLFASGWYGDAPWELFFTAVEGKPNEYQLMEKVPTVVYYLKTFYAPSYTTGAGLLGAGNTVIIHDARGAHTVNVEPI